MTQLLARWNSSELYARVGEKWKLVRSHWLYTKPDLKTADAVARQIVSAAALY